MDDEAKNPLASSTLLPFVQNKLTTFELLLLKAYPGFERLFEKT
jgi:hypothetical protein